MKPCRHHLHVITVRWALNVAYQCTATTKIARASPICLSVLTVGRTSLQKRRDSSPAVGFPSDVTPKPLIFISLTIKIVTGTRAHTRTHARASISIMPNKSNNQHIQPAEFKQIRELVLKRAHNRCEFCGVSKGLCITEGHGWFPVVLSIAHLDCDPTNNDPSNLRALCQRCYKKLDAEHHVEIRANTKAAKDKSLEIPFDY